MFDDRPIQGWATSPGEDPLELAFGGRLRQQPTPRAKTLADLEADVEEREAHLAKLRATPPPADGGAAGVDSGLVGQAGTWIMTAEAALAQARRKLDERRRSLAHHVEWTRSQFEAATERQRIAETLMVKVDMDPRRRADLAVEAAKAAQDVAEWEVEHREAVEAARGVEMAA